MSLELHPDLATIDEMAAAATIDNTLRAELLDWATGRFGAETAEAAAKHELAHLLVARQQGYRYAEASGCPLNKVADQ
jgi:hypothetical protein